MKKALIIGLSAIAIGTGGMALAEPGAGMKRDADGNGVITRAEAQASAQQRFARMDANNDGAITEADREARMTAHRTKMFDSLDANKNGQISRDEFMAFRHGDKGKGMGKGDHDGHRMGMRGMRGGGMMKMADANNDGRISQAEFTAMAMSHFDSADANKDGQVSGEERQAMRGKWRDQHRDHNAS